MHTKIRDLRKAKGWSQGELAHRAGVRVATISKAEKTPERVEFQTLIKVADGLGVHLSDLFDVDVWNPTLRQMISNFLRLPERQREAFTHQIEALAEKHGKQGG